MTDCTSSEPRIGDDGPRFRNLSTAPNSAPNAPESTIDFLKQALPELCRATGATAGIVWERTENGQLRWLAGHKIDPTLTTEDSEYTRDLLLNVNDVFCSGQPEVFAPLHEHILTEQGDFAGEHVPRAGSERQTDPLRRLVLGCWQLLVPIARQPVNLALHLFLPGHNPSSAGTELLSAANVLIGQIEDDIRPFLRPNGQS